MNHATFHFHGGLNDFLPRQQRDKSIEHPFNWRASIKDMIESLGIPHAEIDILVVNGQSVDFDYVVQGGDEIHIYPYDEAAAVAEKIPLRPPLDGKVRFVLDTHLGRLSAYLRMLGFDTLYRNDYGDEELAQISYQESRILLTRDIGLLKRKTVIYGYFVRNTDSKKRLVEVIHRFHLLDAVEPFKYCMKCNGLLHMIPKEAVLDRISEQTARYYDQFHHCPSCDQVYWMGSHYQRMQQFMEEVLAR
jgi:hypothetical protein